MRHLLPLLSLALLAACGGGGNSSALTPITSALSVPSVVATPVNYTALGDSLTLGGKSSSPATDFVSLVGAALHAQTVTNLGIGGQTASPMTGLLTGGLAFSYAGVLATEVPNIPLNTNLVSLFIGTNDEFLSIGQVDAGSDPAAIFPATTSAYAESMTSILAAIKARVPSARIVLLTVPNPTWRYAAGESVAVKSGITSLDNAMRADMIATGNVVADLQCDPAMYNNANFPNPYDVHPNDAGHAIIAKDVLAALAGTAVLAPTCAYQQSLI